MKQYYFSHEANTRNDEKVLMLRMEHGWEGYGVYWMLVEMMFESPETYLSFSKLKGIAFSNNIDLTKLQQVVNTCVTENLFVISVTDDDKFVSLDLLNKKEKVVSNIDELAKKKSEAGKKSAEKRWGTKKETIENIEENNTIITESNTSVTGVKSVSNTGITENAINKIKEDKIKEDKIKDNNNNSISEKGSALRNEISIIMRLYNFDVNNSTLDNVIKNSKGDIELIRRQFKNFHEKGIGLVMAAIKDNYPEPRKGGRDDGHKAADEARAREIEESIAKYGF